MTVVKSVLKRWSGTAWDPVYLKSVSDIVEVGADLELNKTTKYTPTDTIPANDTIQNVLGNIASQVANMDIADLKQASNYIIFNCGTATTNI